MPFTVRLCCNMWSLHRDLTSVSPLAAFCHSFASDRADTSRPELLPPLLSALSQRSLLSSCPSSSWVISRTLELLPSINGTATGGMLSLGEPFVVRGKSLSIKRAGKGIVVFYPGDLYEALVSKMQQPRSCFLWTFKGGARSRRIRWWGDISQHRLAPRQANPASVKVRSRCAHPPCRAEFHLLWSLLQSHKSHHKAVRKRKHVCLFPIVCFSFNNDCYNS